MNAPRLISAILAGALCLWLVPGVFAAKSRSSKGSKASSKAAAKSSAKASPTPAAKASPPPAPNKDWEVIKVGPRDYLSLDNVAKFYGLIGNVDSTGKTVVLNNGRNQLQVTLDSREAIVNGVRNWLCFPVIAHDNKFLVSRIDLAKTVEPQLRPHMIQRAGKIQTIVLDPGHGGFDKGATNAFGREKDFALDVARQLRPMLQAKGFKVVMTRETDVFIPLEVRARMANATKDSIFVSIHFNATGSNPNATGFEIFSLTPRGAPSTNDDSLALHFVNMQAGSPMEAHSFELAAVVYHSMLGHIPEEFDRGIKRARFAVLRQTKVPSILVEGGFLSEASGDAKRIADPEWRKQLADAICSGIEGYRALVEKKQRPMLVAEYRARAAGEITVVDLASPPSKLDQPMAVSNPPFIPIVNPVPAPAPPSTPVRSAPPVDSALAGSEPEP
ncbi:MAG TPA: N-acetylmuramoyl-L-alanine amidase [Chthoniobacterales bacterium]|jgi:N-acetylmuramoyl-L-alanine amidase|nr:N-acetylmuramoyl-L-alanine amidase [Chthoniobacterales bacterium]